MDALSARIIEWSAAERALDPRGESGDHYLVTLHARGALVAVADGLGHGPEAAVAARLAMATLEADPQQSVEALLRRCHERLRPTRGAALSVACFDARDETMAWVGVGNVEGVLLRVSSGDRSPHLVLPGGVVGRQLPPLKVSRVRVAPGDVLILATDGICAEFAEAETPSGSVRSSAERILARYATGTDDALVVVVRYQGRPDGREAEGRVA